MDMWKRAQIGAVWMRDSFASWFATSWLYIILWGVVAGAFTVLLYIDGIFSRHLAPESINPLSFQAMGWTYRFFAASFLMAAARYAHKGIKGGATFKWLGLFASLIVCMHAWGFGLEALSDRRDQAMAVREVVAIAETNNTELIDALKARKAQIDVDTDKAVAALNAEITQYITDGRNNDDLADDSRTRRNALQDQALADKRAIDDQILQLVTSGAQQRTEAVEVKADSTAWAPLFVGMAQLFTWNREPSDWAIYLCAVAFIVFWVLLAESLVIFLPERIYKMHLHDADAGRTKDPTRVAAGKKAAETVKRKNRRIKKIEEQWAGYEKTWLAGLKKAKSTNWTAEAINDYHFNGQVDHIIAIGRRAGTRPEFEAEVRIIKRLDENLPATTKPNNIDIIDPEPGTLNGSGKPKEGDTDADDDTGSDLAY